MSGIDVTEEVLAYAKSKNKPNILIFRDMPFGGCGMCSGDDQFKVGARLLDDAPSERFSLVQTIGNVSVWVERPILSRIENSSYTKVYLKDGFFKGLKISLGPELTDRA